MRGVLDLHSDEDHHRSVITMAGTSDELIEQVVALATVVMGARDLRIHAGVHPRFGLMDVVPFVPLGSATLDDAVRARDAAATALAEQLELPCFLYGPLADGSQRTLPEVRRDAFATLSPDTGPSAPHPTAGAVAVGARAPMVAWNLWVGGITIDRARQIARAIRSEHVRSLGFELENAVQISCNLLAPSLVTPADLADQVQSMLGGEGEILRAELVGLAPQACLMAIDPDRWAALDLSWETTIEERCAAVGVALG